MNFLNILHIFPTVQASYSQCLETLGFGFHSILKFDDLFKYNVVSFMHQYSTKRLPTSFDSMFTLTRETEDIHIRDSYYFYQVIIIVKKAISHFPRVVYIPILNSLSSQYQSTLSHKVFKKESKNLFLDRYKEFEHFDNLQCLEWSS